MVEEVKAFKASDATVYPTWLGAMKRESYLALQQAHLGNHFTAVYELAHQDASARAALIKFAEVLKEMY